MRVVYGPPGLRGVSSIVGLGAEDAAEAAYADQLVVTTRRTAATLTIVSIASWLLGARSLARVSATGLGALVAVMALARR